MYIYVYVYIYIYIYVVHMFAHHVVGIDGIRGSLLAWCHVDLRVDAYGCIWDIGATKSGP